MRILFYGECSVTLLQSGQDVSAGADSALRRHQSSSQGLETSPSMDFRASRRVLSSGNNAANYFTELYPIKQLHCMGVKINQALISQTFISMMKYM